MFKQRAEFRRGSHQPRLLLGFAALPVPFPSGPCLTEGPGGARLLQARVCGLVGSCR